MNLNLEKNEQKLLNDLYLYNKRLEEVYFSSNKDEKIITMIEDIINEKLKRITPKTAYKLLNNLYKDNLIDKYHGNEIKIINDLNIDLAKQRLGIDLLKTALSSSIFFDLFNENITTGFDNYCINNMIPYFLNGCPYLNYLFILDHAEIFLGLINSNKNINNTIKENINIKNLKEREDKHVINTEETEKKEKVETKQIEESKDVTQGKLVIGLDIDFYKPDSKYAMCIYNVILGESATSKMFQNVREKAGLAYSARSTYVRQKNNIYIRAGIEIENFEKALKIIKEQLEDMRNGKFTDEEIENAKKYMVSGIKNVQDEQDSEITYYMGQELSGKLLTFDEYIDKINDVTRKQIENIASKIHINTIYFLRNKEQ